MGDTSSQMFDDNDILCASCLRAICQWFEICMSPTIVSSRRPLSPVLAMSFAHPVVVRVCHCRLPTKL